jgi:disulfide bond formation protein DsbB
MANGLALPNSLRTEPIALAAVVIAAVGAAAILGAFFFQYQLGLRPCPLCLEQRIAYYVSIPLAIMVLLGVSVGSSRKVLMAALIAIAAAMIWNAGLGAYHSGVEWKWWEGPKDCTGEITSLGSAGGLLKQMQATSLVRCDEAAWRFLGLSLAGYNVLISLGLAAVALWGFWRAWQTRAAYGSSSVSQ